MWKNNRNNRDCQFGVDLDRNFRYKDDLQNSIEQPCNPNFGGNVPFGEPESQIIRMFFMTRQAKIYMHMSFHTGDNFVGNYHIVSNFLSELLT